MFNVNIWSIIAGLCMVTLLIPLSVIPSLPTQDYEHCGTDWVCQTVDTAENGDVGRFTSLAIDSADNPHIGYNDFTNQDIKYAAWDGLSWQIETAVSAGAVGRGISLVLDEGGNPHISSVKRYGYDVSYAYWDGSTWHTEVVVPGASKGLATSLALNSSGYPSISYQQAITGDSGVRYAYWDDSSWQIDVVFSGDAGWYTSLALNSSDYPHISYYDKTNNDLKYARWDGSSWQIETIDSVGNPSVGAHNSLALDSSDNAHVSYNDGTNGDLKYAYWEGSSWQIETVDSTGEVGEYNSLALDSSDRPHISYYDETNGDLKYAHWDGSSWQIETIDSGGDVGHYTSLALDSSGSPHISYTDWTNRDLKYTRWYGSSWQIETADIGDELSVGRSNSLALDSSGNAHISYHKFVGGLGTSGTLKYARWDGSRWQVETVASGGYGIGRGTSIQLDNADNPHISCVEKYGYNLRYIYWDGSNWQVEVVVPGHSLGLCTSLALNSLGYPSISYQQAITGDSGVRYAYWDDSSWQIDVVFSGDAGWYTSLALNSSDYPHISYYDKTNNDLKYARWDGSSWQIETIDSVGNPSVGAHNSLALDSSDNAHVSYNDGTNGDLKYAYWDGSSWQIETVDSTGEVGEYNSLALDSSDRPHISYNDETNGDLKYAHWDGSSWQIETIDSIGDIADQTSLALDSTGIPHISYYDATNHNLKFARYSSTHTLTINSTGPGGVFVPGEGTFTYPYGTEVYLEAIVPPCCCTFDQWTGDVDTVFDIYAWCTYIAMYGDYSITANFVPWHITDLDCSAIGHDIIRLTWMPYCGVIGGAYDSRYSTSPITEVNWEAAQQCTNEPTPQDSGHVESFDVCGLAPDTIYYLRLKVANAGGIWSHLSNQTSCNTLSPTPTTTHTPTPTIPTPTPNVTVTPTPTLLSPSLSISPAVFCVESSESLNLTATLTYDSNPLLNKLITWSATEGTFSPISAYTDAQGLASTIYYPPAFDKQTPLTITASFAGDEMYSAIGAASFGTGLPLEVTPEDEGELEELRLRVQILEEAIGRGDVGALVNIQVEVGTLEITEEVYAPELSVEVTESGEEGKVELIVSSEAAGGKTIVINVDNNTLPISSLEEIELLFDDEEIELADDYEDVLVPSGEGAAEYLVLLGENGIQVLVSIPQFSEHTITITTETPPIAGEEEGIPLWVWVVLGIFAALLVLLVAVVFRHIFKQPTVQVEKQNE